MTIQNIDIFLVDTEAGNLKSIQEFFQPIGAEVFFTSDHAAALQQLEIMRPKLVFLSIRLARLDKWGLLTAFNEQLIPVIGLVEHGQSQWMHEGHLHGLNANLISPIDTLQLKAYFPSLISQVWPNNIIDSEKERRSCHDRRSRAIGTGRRWYDQLNQLDNYEYEKTGVVEVGPFAIDNLKKCVYRNEQNLKLSPKEYQLFILLLKNKDEVVASSEIITIIWADSSRASEEDVKQYIYMLRHKIEADPAHPCLIHTVKGVGYMLSCVL